MQRSPFESALELVEQWLDHGEGCAWAVRERDQRADQGAAWNIDLQDPSAPVAALRLVLPPDFPASACQFFVDKRHFLQVPHVELDGKVCLGVVAAPSDFSDPVGAVVRALHKLRTEFLAPSLDPAWVQEQFQAERDSYWAQMCAGQTRTGRRRASLGTVFIDTGEFSTWATGATAGFQAEGGKAGHFRCVVVTASSADPERTAQRHGWGGGTMVRGDALFVRLAADARWTPSIWPKDLQQLDALVSAATDDNCSLTQWVGVEANRDARAVRRIADPGHRPRIVALALGSSVFGYRILNGSPGAPQIEPLVLTRVDPDWALARDQELDVLHARRRARVLFLGCGSLGSPLARVLVRAGIGHLDMVDLQTMDSENTSRHHLGLSKIDKGKAEALAREFRADVPGLQTEGFLAEAKSWLMRHSKPGNYDLIVDCTADSGVRTFMSTMRTSLFGQAPVIHAWTEPLCSAGHVVLSQPEVPWPASDPADDLVNASDLSADATQVRMPACAGGFHPYGAADIELVAAFAAQRVLSIIDHPKQESTVWSWVRSSGYFDTLPMAVSTRSIVPLSTHPSDSATITRRLVEVLKGE